MLRHGSNKLVFRLVTSDYTVIEAGFCYHLYSILN